MYRNSLAIPTLQREDYKTGISILIYKMKNCIKVFISVYIDDITYLNDILKEY